MSDKVSPLQTNISVARGEYIDETIEEINLEGKIVKLRDRYHLQISAWFVIDREYPETYQPQLRVECKATKYARSFAGHREGNNFKFKLEIPTIYLLTEVKCTVIISNHEAHIIQESEDEFIPIENKFTEKFPKVLWRSFNEYFPEIKDALWYINADPKRTVTVYFNEDIKYFRVSINYPGTNDEFYGRFFDHFRQSYTTALLLGVDGLSRKNLETLQDIDTPYHSKMVDMLTPLLEETDNRWILFAYINQIATKISDRFRKLLKKDMVI